jgi:hypothetical protein
LRYTTTATIDSILLYEDEKGPISAKTYGGASWSPVQPKLEKAQKTRGFLNIFGVYDYANNEMFTHCYKKRNGDQFLDFIRRVDRKYDSTIKQIFLVLDNISIHKSHKVKEIIQKYHSRIKLVFLPIRSPELNLIEVRWLWLQRQAINNSTFVDEHDIGRAVSNWTNNYNRNHGFKIITNILHKELSVCLHNC